MAYPNKIDTTIDLPIAVDNVTPVSGAIFNKLRNAVIAVQSELGTKPSGTYGTIKARFDAIDFLLTNLNSITLSKDLGGTASEVLVIGIQGNPVSNVTPQLGNALRWDGIAWIPQDPGPIPENLAQTDWHINSVTGSDTATGASSSTPIKTYAEYTRRCGISRNVPQGLKLHIHADMPESDPIIGNFIVGAEGYVDVIAESLEVLHTGTISTYRTFNRSTKTPPGFTDVGVADWTPYVGKLVQITSGSHASQNACFWIAKNEGGGVARISFPKYRDPSFTFTETAFVPQVGDTYKILELRKASIGFTIEGTSGPVTRLPSRVEFFKPAAANLSSQSAYTVISSALIAYWWCDFQFVGTDCVAANTIMCRFSGIIGTLGSLSASSCLFQNTVDFAIKGCLFLGDTFVQGATRPRFHYPGESGIYCDSPTGDFAIFDSGLWFFVDQGATVSLKCNVWGAGNTGALVQIHAGTFLDKMTTFNYDSTANGNGAYSAGSYDFIINSKTTALAIDPGTLQRIYPPRDLTFTNLRANVSAGGFGGSATDPYTLMGIISGNSQSAYTSAENLAWSQPVWDIDPINGNDNNTGLLGQPLKTAAEQHRRVGPIHEITGTMSTRTPIVTMHIRSSLPSTDTLTVKLMVKPPASSFQGNDKTPYQIFGSLPTPAASGTVTSVRSFDQANNITWGFASSLGNMATHVRAGRIAIRTNIVDSNTPLAWWLAKNEDGSTARISYPTYFNPNDIVNAQTSPSPTFQAGDTFSLYDLPTVPSATIEAQGFAQFPIIARHINFGPGNPQTLGNTAFTECSFNGNGFAGAGFSPTNCQFNGIWTIATGTKCYVTYGLFLNSLMIMQGHPTFQNYTMFQGCSQLATDGGLGIHCHTRGFQVYDSAGDGWIVYPGDIFVYAGGMIGTGNTGYGLRVMRGGRCTVGGLGASGGRFFRQTGTLGDFNIGGNTSGPALNLTDPYGWTTAHSYTWDNFNTSVAGGGFNQSVFDPTCPGCGIILEG